MSDLYTRMTDYIGLKGSKLIPELFKMVVDEKEAELMLAMPGTPEQLSEKTGFDVDNVEEMCKFLYHKGVAFKSFKGGKLGYKMCRHLIQFHDATILWKEAPIEFLDLWQRFMEEEWPIFARAAFKNKKRTPGTRVIPVQQSIETGKQQILDADSVDTIVENAEVLAVTRCTCRVIAHKCEKPQEVCLQVNNAARYTIDRGSGREVTKDEAFAILRKAEEEGLIHITMNKTHVGHFICNCCSCCCQTMPLIISEGLKITSPSRFEASIDPDECTACGTCVDRCFFSAISEVENENGDTVMKVDPEKCLGCGLCHPTCPVEAVSLKEVREVEFIPE